LENTVRAGAIVDKPTALVVEDDIDLAQFVSRVLQKVGFEVAEVHTGLQALAALGSTVPNLVILDIGLPQVSGIEILEGIKRDARLSQTYVIITTAYSQLPQTVKDQADLVLSKPVPYAKLRDLSRELAASTA
jgi:CheY-like chemotaxis protein